MFAIVQEIPPVPHPICFAYMYLQTAARSKIALRYELIASYPNNYPDNCTAVLCYGRITTSFIPPLRCPFFVIDRVSLSQWGLTWGFCIMSIDAFRNQCRWFQFPDWRIHVVTRDVYHVNPTINTKHTLCTKQINQRFMYSQGRFGSSLNSGFVKKRKIFICHLCEQSCSPWHIKHDVIIPYFDLLLGYNWE